jgi:lipopolysaccharide assembly outer membrane protein LptD (OstA)
MMAQQQDSAVAKADTIRIAASINDSIPNDSLPNDSIPYSKHQISPNAPKTKVEYFAKDSMIIALDENMIYLYGNAELNYETTNLQAAYIDLSFETNVLNATGMPDSTGKVIGKPVFNDDGQSFDAEYMKYNFNSKKGYIQEMVTEQGDAYLFGKEVKKLENDQILVKDGYFTTCPCDENQDYYIRFKKAKVIPNDKIVTGPVWLVIEEVPTPLVAPFGFFPNQKGRSSGILIPTYGESANRGFFLENGGYYFAINDYLDLILRGDIYSRGSWALKTESNYIKRYKYNGNFNLSYATNIIGTKDDPDYSKQHDFFIKWTHQQDPKANPNSRFAASVNAGSSTFNTYNPSSTNDYLSNTFQSNISYSTTIANKYNLSLNFRHSQNTLSKKVDMSLPEIAFSANQFYPFRSKQAKGKLKWYENISMKYIMNAKNSISTYDSLLFTNTKFSDFQNGIKHDIPISSNIKVLKHFNWNNTINYTGRFYFQEVQKSWNNQDSLGQVLRDTTTGFHDLHEFSFSSGINTRLYGMVQFKKSPVRAIRHVMVPGVNFRYRPDYSKAQWGYYGYYLDGSNVDPILYSYYENGIYAYPLSNNLEMKVRNRKDTASGLKKVVLIENLTISSGYDLARDSLNWNVLSVSGYTKLFKVIDVRFAGVWDPYVVDSSGVRLNRYEWNENNRLFRKNSSDWALSFGWNLNSNKFKDKNPTTSDKGTTADREDIARYPERYVDFDNPWSLNLYYTFRYTNNWDQFDNRTSKTIQTLSFSGDINLTNKWKVGFTSGYDFENKSLSYTSLNVYRDLHCWEMIVNWIPFGFRKSYNLTIRVKSPILQDLKYTKKTDWRDY